MKTEKIIMVVQRDILFGKDYFEGFKNPNEVDYESRILQNFKWMKKNVAEHDPTHKQPVGYSMIVNPDLKQVFAYQRSSEDAEYTEKRLQGKWSWGVGGHIERFDNLNRNPIHASMMRELEEEVETNDSAKPKLLGYINYDSDNVGEVHFGILYLVETHSKIIRPKDPEIDSGQLRSVEELQNICSAPKFIVEEWSRISLEPLKEYLRII